MATSFCLPKALLDKLKKRAEQEGRTVSSMLSVILATVLSD